MALTKAEDGFTGCIVSGVADVSMSSTPMGAGVILCRFFSFVEGDIKYLVYDQSDDRARQLLNLDDD